MSAKRKVVGFLSMIVGVAFVLYLTTLRDFNLYDYITQLAVVVTGAVIGVGYWTFKPEVDKHFQKENVKTTPEVVITESLADKQKDRDEYTRHLREDILGIIEPHVSGKQNPQYANAIRNVKENKKMILQHLFTYEKALYASSPVYTRYVEICEKDNEFANSSFKINELRLDLQIDESNISNVHNDDFLHVDYEILFGILGFPPNTDFSHKPLNLDNIRIVEEYLVGANYFHVFEDGDDPFHKYHIKHAQKTIAKTNSKKNAEKFLQLLLKYCPKIVKTVHDIKLNKDVNIRINKPAFDLMFSHIRETVMVGKPNLGVCDACVSFFPHGNKMNYRKFLANFNCAPWNWAEEFWGKP